METPTFNAGNRKIVNFKDFLADPKAEEQELKDIKRSFSDNENGQCLQQHKYKFNKVTHKMDDLVEDEVDDKLDAFVKEGTMGINFTELAKDYIEKKGVEDASYTSGVEEFAIYLNENLAL